MLANLTHSHYWTVAGWTMLHFLWIGGLIGLIAIIGKAALRSASPNSRYLFGLTCLVLLAATPIGTFIYLAETHPASSIVATAEDARQLPPGQTPEIIITAEAAIQDKPDTAFLAGGQAERSGNSTTPSGSSDSLPPQDTLGAVIDRTKPVLTTAADIAPWLWIIGAPLVFLLLATGLIGAERLKKTADQITAGPIHELSTKLAESLQVAGKVSVGISKKVASPVLVGIIRPMILLPPIALTGWSAAQIEMVLLHELAHVRRWDNLINLMQRSIEAILFFHPAVWLISRWIRLEREHCCDAIVLSHGSKPQSYAEMLFSMASTPRMDQAAVAMSQNDLVPRIRRILQLEPTVMKYSRTLIAVIAVTVVATSLGAGAFASQDAEPENIEIIIDDKDPNVTWNGRWEVRDVSKDKFNKYYCFASKGDGGKTATFTPDITTPGIYEVYAWWPKGQNRTSYAEFQISHRDGTSTISRDQKAHGGQWNLLGCAWFDKGTEGNVTITNNMPGWNWVIVMADAVKFKYVGDDKNVKPSFESETPVPFTPEEIKQTLDLMVVDAESRKPLQGVHLTMTYGKEWTDWREMRTDKKGLCRIPVPKKNLTHLFIDVRESGYSPVEVRWKSKNLAELPKRYELQLEPGTKIGGTVVDEDGNPVSDVKVHLRVRNDKDELLRRNWVDETLITDSQGKWVCDSFPRRVKKPGIRLIHQDYISDTYDETRHPPIAELKSMSWVATLATGNVLEGQVLDNAGNPVPEAKVIRGRYRWTGPNNERTTDARGRFRFPGFSPGPDYLTVTAPGFAPVLEEIDVLDNPKPVEFRLQPGRTFKGRVEDQFGNPVEGVNVDLQQWRGCYSLDWRADTDSDGRFEWNDAPLDEFSIRMNRSGYVSRYEILVPTDDQEFVYTMNQGLLLTGNVTDAQTGNPISSFIVKPGTIQEDSSIAWKSNYSSKGRNGSYDFTIEEPDGTVLSIEAEGYLPMVSPVFTGIGEQTFDAALQRGTGLTGIVHTPDGKPATDVDVLQASSDFHFSITNGRTINEQPGLNVIVTDGQGQFTLPAQSGSFKIICLSDQGFARATAEQLAESEVLTLQPWGSIEGTYFIGTKPAAGEQVNLSTISQDPTADTVHFHYSEIVNEDGTFRFDRVKPGLVSVCNQVSYPDGSAHYGTYLPAKVEPGKTCHVKLGGTGRPLVGKITVPESLQSKVKSHHVGITLMEQPPVPPIPSDVVRQGLHAVRLWHKEWSRTKEAIPYMGRQRRYPIKLNSDYTFRTEDVPAGKYELSIVAYDTPEGTRHHYGPVYATGKVDVMISEMEGGRSDEPYDAGDVPIVKYSKAQNGSRRSTYLPFPCLDGKLRMLSDYHGKVVLLNNSSRDSDECVEEFEALKQIRDRYADNPNVVMVGTHKNESVEKTEQYLKEHGLDWPHMFVDEKHTDTFNGLVGTEVQYPSYLILIPGSLEEPKIDLKAEDLKAEIEKALQKIE